MVKYIIFLFCILGFILALMQTTDDCHEFKFKEVKIEETSVRCSRTAATLCVKDNTCELEISGSTIKLDSLLRENAWVNDKIQLFYFPHLDEAWVYYGYDYVILHNDEKRYFLLR